MQQARKHAIKAISVQGLPALEAIMFTDPHLVQRALRSTQPTQKIIYEFSDDVGILHQYYLLRDTMFISLCGGTIAFPQPDAFDAASQILVARQGRHCLAGGRLTISGPTHRQHLPMEEGGKRLSDRFPEYELQDCAYAEFSCFARLPEFSDSQAIPTLMRSLIRRTIAEGIEHLFLTIERKEMNFFQQAAQDLGIGFDIVWMTFSSENEEGGAISRPVSIMHLSHLLPTPARVTEKAVAE